MDLAGFLFVVFLFFAFFFLLFFAVYTKPEFIEVFIHYFGELNV